MYIKDMMTHRAVSVAPDEPITAAARLRKRDHIGRVPGCDSKGQLQGSITDRDIVLRCVAAGVDPDKTLIRDVMTTGVFTVSPTDTVESAAALMGKAQVRRLPVCENGTLVGMLSLGDLACSGACNMEASAALTEISSGVQHRTGK